MKYFIIFISFFLLASYPGSAWAQSKSRILIDLAKENVDVTTGFQGSEIVVFGSIEKAGTSPSVVVLLKGPNTQVIVRKKEDIAGMWLNSDSIIFKNIPHFYDYAISSKEQDIGSAQTLIDNGIGLNTLVFEPDDSDDRQDQSRFREFQEALIRNWQQQGNFPLGAKKIKFLNDALFRADFVLPANIPTGSYHVEAFLFESGKLIDQRERVLEVKQAGMSAVINNYAHEHAMIYALFGFSMAIGMGLLSTLLSKKGR